MPSTRLVSVAAAMEPDDLSICDISRKAKVQSPKAKAQSEPAGPFRPRRRPHSRNRIRLKNRERGREGCGPIGHSVPPARGHARKSVLATGRRQFNLPPVSILEELKWRGLVADCTDAAELSKKVSAPITLYCGFDPTADSLHVGNLVPLLALRRFQLLGHHPIAVAGGATGMVGDPSGKTSERQLLTPEVLAHNISRVKEQLKKLLDFDTKINSTRLVDSPSWRKDVSFLDFLRDIGKHFSVNQMVAKESVRARMEDREVGISYTEFSYMLLQAFDFMVLCRDQNCELQIGGSDQWGNITAGIELTRKKLGKQGFGLTLPLITNADGTKFGKTEAGTQYRSIILYRNEAEKLAVEKSKADLA